LPTGRELLERLQAQYPGAYSDRLLRTLQRRLKLWRGERARTMIFGALASGSAESARAVG